MTACEKCKSEISADAKFCANCGRPVGKPGLIYSIGAIAIMIGTAVLIVQTCGGSDSPSTPTTATDTTPAAPETQRHAPLKEIYAAETIADALRVSVPLMTDSSPDAPNAGAALFIRWADAKMRWSDVAVKKDETSVKMAKKDSRAARGKLLCVRGELSQIARDTGTLGYVGILVTRDADVVAFMAMGNTGTLVEDSQARFCGVVTGLFIFQNALGGHTESIQMVGMFDLPENRD